MTKRPDDEYREAVYASGMPSRMIVVAVAMSHSMDYKTLASAYPGVDLLAERTGLHRRTVQRTLVDLIEAGWLIKVKEARGRGHAAIYKGTIPKGWRDATLCEEKGWRDATVSDRERVAVDTEKGGPGPPHLNPPVTKVHGGGPAEINGSGSGSAGAPPAPPTDHVFAMFSFPAWAAIERQAIEGNVTIDEIIEAWGSKPDFGECMSYDDYAQRKTNRASRTDHTATPTPKGSTP